MEHKESFEQRNVRFLGYNFLKDVRFQGEPVVPRILGEASDINGPHTRVEKLKGIDLNEFLEKNDVSLLEKLRVISHVVGQFIEIDKAGIVLFDRAARNIRVIRWGKHISVRQMDLGEFYDKEPQALYAESRTAYLSDKVEFYSRYGFNMWSESVGRLLEDVRYCLKRELDMAGIQIFSKYTNIEWNEYFQKSKGVPKNRLSRADLLKELKGDILMVIADGEKLSVR